MKYSEKWRQAYDNRNREALSKLLDINCHFIKHSTGEKITKEQILDMWTTKDRVKIQSHRIVYESDEILVQHWFLEWPNGSKDAVLSAMLLNDGQAKKIEFASTPIPQ